MKIPRHSVAIGLMVFLALYAVLSVSPIRLAVGRKHPDFASLLSPPYFNFLATYDDGSVLDFHIGMSRIDLVKRLGDYRDLGVLQGACGAGRLAPVSPPVKIRPEDTNEVLSRNSICLWIPEDKLSVIFHLSNDVIREIEIARVRNEVI